MNELGLKTSNERFGVDGKVKFLKAILNQVTNTQNEKIITELKRERSTFQAQIKKLKLKLTETKADYAD